MVIVDQATGTRATSQPEPEGQPPRFPGYADGPVSWGGVRWFSFPLSMLADTDADVRQQNMIHGLFHRIQPELGLMAGTDEGHNEHLDTLEGRVWMQLEWRALRRAVESGGSDRAAAVADALAFRSERRRLFPGAAENERVEFFRERLPSGAPALLSGPIRPPMPTVPMAAAPQAGPRRQSSSEIRKRPDPPTVYCWTISGADNAGRFVAQRPRTLATCSPRQRTGHCCPSR